MRIALGCAATLLLLAAFGCASEPVGSGDAGGGTGGFAGESGGFAGESGGAAGSPAQDAGAELFATNCVACHDEQGRGGLLAPGIQHPIRDYFTWVVRNGRSATRYPMPMAAWSTTELSEADLALVFDYLDAPPQPVTGAALFVDYCANCHGLNAQGGVVQRSLLNQADKVEEMARSGAGASDFEARLEFMPAFTTARLSDADLRLIRDFVASL